MVYHSDPFLLMDRMRLVKIIEFSTNIHLLYAGIAKQVLDRCVVSNPRTRDPKNKEFEVVFDYSFVEDHQDKDTRWLI